MTREVHPLHLIQVNNALILRDRTVNFLAPEEYDFEPSSAEFSKLNEIFRHIRVISRQAALPFPEKFVAVRIQRIAAIPRIRFPADNDEPLNAKINFRSIDNAIKIRHVAEADRRAASKHSPDIADEILLEAVASYFRSDWTKAILFSAIAMEIFVGSTIDTYLAKALNSNPRPKHLRIKTVKVKSEKSSTRDIVFRFLRDKGDFRSLIGEISEYTFRRSLLNDDPGLFQQAAKLYRTRNKIVHKGAPSADSNDVFQLSQENASEAIAIAKSVCAWYGSKLVYPLIEAQLIKGKILTIYAHESQHT